MKIKNTLCLALIATATLSTWADNEWMHIFYKNSKGVTRVVSADANSLKDIKYLNPATDGSFKTMSVTNTDGTKQITMTNLVRCEVGKNIPILRIEIENNAEVVNKDTYLNATATLEGNGLCDDFAATTFQIKGRGNSTWGYPKKPYRMKFDKKQSLAGLPKKTKNFALIANYIDPTQMRNVLALWIARKLDMPFTNHTTPVELYINGTYRGHYFITEKIGLNSASVDVDETQGILWELDSYFDETYRFASQAFQLPVMVNEPDFDELEAADPTVTAKERFTMWQDDFTEFEMAVAGKNGKDWTDLMDMESLAKYMLVYCIAVNQEIKHPKSTYLHKAKIGDKYTMGPAWDFDWAYTYDGRELTTQQYKPLLVTNTKGYSFFYPMLSDPRFQTMYKKLMNDFFENNWDEFMAFFDQYAKDITPAAYHNGEKWTGGESSSEKHAESVATLRTFLEQRRDYMKSSASGGLY